jgi:hypothetical protein
LAIIYARSFSKPKAAKIIEERIKPVNTATPPKYGVACICDVLPLGISYNPFECASETIGGIDRKVIINAVSDPPTINNHAGKFIVIKSFENSISVEIKSNAYFLFINNNFSNKLNYFNIRYNFFNNPNIYKNIL